MCPINHRFDHITKQKQHRIPNVFADIQPGIYVLMQVQNARTNSSYPLLSSCASSRIPTHDVFPSLPPSLCINAPALPFSLVLLLQASKGEPSHPSAEAEPAAVEKEEEEEDEEEEEESCDYGCAPRKAAPASTATAGDSEASPPASEDAAAAAAAATAAGHLTEGQDNPVVEEDGSEGSVASVNEAGAVPAASADTPADERAGNGDAAAAAAAVAVTSDEEEEKEDPTDEDLLEAIRGIPTTVDDVEKLTPKQVRTRLQTWWYQR